MIIAKDFVEILKILHCVGYDELYEVLGVESWPCRDDFEDIIWSEWRQNVFEGLCMLDEANQQKAINYAEAKMLKYRMRNSQPVIGVFIPAMADAEERN